MGLMSLNLANLNARGLRDPSKCSHLLGELSNLRINVAVVQETHFTCAMDCWGLEDDFVVHSAYVSHSCVRCSLNADVNLLLADENLVLADDGSQLVVVNVAVKSFVFWLAAVYATNIAAERLSFF